VSPDLDDLGLGRLLSPDAPLRPSSGFTASVMDRVRETAAQPPPLAFPWTRFATGVTACLACSALGTAVIVNTNVVLAIAEPLEAAAPEIGFAAAAVLASFAALRVGGARVAHAVSALRVSPRGFLRASRR
jgi:hypothetical protein